MLLVLGHSYLALEYALIFPLRWKLCFYDNDIQTLAGQTAP